MTPAPTTPSEHVRNIAKDLILTILTCFLFNIYVQNRQMKAVNAMLKEQKYSFGRWLLLSSVTCGLYHIYHEYRQSQDIAAVLKDLNPNEPILMILLSVLGLTIVVDAIQQSHINRFYGSTQL